MQNFRKLVAYGTLGLGTLQVGHSLFVKSKNKKQKTNYQLVQGSSLASGIGMVILEKHFNQLLQWLPPFIAFSASALLSYYSFLITQILFKDEIVVSKFEVGICWAPVLFAFAFMGLIELVVDKS